MVRILILVAALMFGVSILLALLPSIVNTNEATRTQSASDTGLSCSTAVGETSCEVTISTRHEYATNSQMTVSETSPSSVDRTATTTVATDRRTLTVAGLTQSTSYLFNVSYAEIADNVSEGLNDLMSLMPILLVIGFIAVVLISAFVVMGGGRRGAFG